MEMLPICQIDGVSMLSWTLMSPDGAAVQLNHDLNPCPWIGRTCNVNRLVHKPC